MKRIAVADTTCARFDMTQAAIDELKRGGLGLGKARGRDFQIVRVTVPGVKDLAVACLRLLNDGCDIALALGTVGASTLDKTAAHEASTAIQQAMLMSGKHILEAFVYHEETETDDALAALCEGRSREHALNALWLLFAPRELERRAGTGYRHAFPEPSLPALREP
jgi:riboflavin synthase